MKVFTRDNLDIIESSTPIKGSIALRELYFQPGWKVPKTNVLFSYKDQGLLAEVYFEFGRKYSFTDLQTIIRKHLAVNGDNDAANIYHNNGRVTFWLNRKNKLNFPITDVKFCDELLSVLKLETKTDYTGIMHGNPLPEDNITLIFYKPKMIYFKCDQLEDDSKTLAMLPGHKTSLRDVNSLFLSLNTYQPVYNLTCSLTDEKGNNLPLEKIDFRLLNKE